MSNNYSSAQNDPRDINLQKKGDNTTGNKIQMPNGPTGNHAQNPAGITSTVNNNIPKAKAIGNYILGKSIGEGTFGKVKLATHILTGEKVAIKILEKDRILDVSDVERVAREIHILKLIRHPNIVQLYEIIETPKQLFLVTEYASGGELFDYIVANQRVKEKEASRFFQQIIAGVEYIHKLKIVHRDMKPENLLLDSSKNIKIVDFGLSNTYKEGELLKTACGSPCYAAPEMIAGKKYKGLTVDIWSCGVILFALVCGYLPFEDPNTALLYKKILNGEYTIPSSVSSEGKDLIKNILNTDPEKRFTMEDIRRHPWMNIVPLPREPEGIIVGYHQMPIDYDILKQLEKYEIDIDYVQKCLDANKHNHATTAYYLLLKRFHHNGGRSKADINSETFESSLLIPKKKQPKNNSILNESLHQIEKNQRDKSHDKHEESFINNFINSKKKTKEATRNHDYSEDSLVQEDTINSKILKENLDNNENRRDHKPKQRSRENASFDAGIYKSGSKDKSTPTNHGHNRPRPVQILHEISNADPRKQRTNENTTGSPKTYSKKPRDLTLINEVLNDSIDHKKISNNHHQASGSVNKQKGSISVNSTPKNENVVTKPPGHRADNRSKDFLNESMNATKDSRNVQTGSRASSGTRKNYESISPQKAGPVPKEPYQPRPSQNTGNNYRMKLHLKNSNQNRIPNEPPQRASVKPSSGYNKERGKSTSMKNDDRSYIDNNTSLNASILNSSYHQNMINHSFDYYQPGRGSVVPNSVNMTAIYSSGGKKKAAKRDQSPLDFYTTNNSMIKHK